MGIAKTRTHLGLASSTSTQLHLPPPKSFQPPSSSLQHLQRYKNQNIALNWAIFLNLGRKIQSYLFYLKMSRHGILEVVIPNPNLDFRSFYPKTHFWANLGRKSQSCPFYMKLAHMVSWRS